MLPENFTPVAWQTRGLNDDKIIRLDVMSRGAGKTVALLAACWDRATQGDHVAYFSARENDLPSVRETLSKWVDADKSAAWGPGGIRFDNGGTISLLYAPAKTYKKWWAMNFQFIAMDDIDRMEPFEAKNPDVSPSSKYEFNYQRGMMRLRRCDDKKCNHSDNPLRAWFTAQVRPWWWNPVWEERKRDQ